VRTEYDLYHWPVGYSTAEPARRLATVQWAMTVAGHEDPTDWTPRGLVKRCAAGTTTRSAMM
jgi:hypothetical protein